MAKFGHTGSGAAASYQQVSVPNTTNMIPGYGSASVAGQLQIAAQGATVDIGDSVMTNNLQMLGTMRANQAARQTTSPPWRARHRARTPRSRPSWLRSSASIKPPLATANPQDANQMNANLALQQIVAKAAAGRDEVGIPRLIGIRKLLQLERRHDQRRAANLLTQAY